MASVLRSNTIYWVKYPFFLPLWHESVIDLYYKLLTHLWAWKCVPSPWLSACRLQQTWGDSSALQHTWKHRVVPKLTCMEDIMIKGCKWRSVQAWILCKLASLSQHVEAHVERNFIDLSETWGMEMEYVRWWEKDEITQTALFASPLPILSSPGISYFPFFFPSWLGLFGFLGKAGVKGQNSTGSGSELLVSWNCHHRCLIIFSVLWEYKLQELKYSVLHSRIIP